MYYLQIHDCSSLGASDEYNDRNYYCILCRYGFHMMSSEVGKGHGENHFFREFSCRRSFVKNIFIRFLADFFLVR